MEGNFFGGSRKIVRRSFGDARLTIHEKKIGTGHDSTKKKIRTAKSLCGQILSVVRHLAVENGPKRPNLSVATETCCCGRKHLWVKSKMARFGGAAFFLTNLAYSSSKTTACHLFYFDFRPLGEG